MEALSKILLSYLNINKYPISPEQFKLHLETHPEYPNLKSISDTFDYFNIVNMVVNVPLEAFSKLPKSFITLYRVKGVDTLVLVEKIRNYVKLQGQQLNVKVEEAYFMDAWSPTVLLVEANESKEKIDIRPSSILYGIVTLLLVGIVAMSQTLDVIRVCHLGLSLFGLYICYLIYGETLGTPNSAASKICQVVSNPASCNSVINDKRGKIFNYISLSDSAIIYFATVFLSSLLIGFDQKLLLILSISSLPVVLLSLYYQAFIIKEWCGLCLGTSIILILQFYLLLYNYKPVSIHWAISVKYTFIAVLISICWLLFKKMSFGIIDLQQSKRNYLRFKRDNSLFLFSLTQSPFKNNFNDAHVNSMVFGAVNPVIDILAITNPSCGYCVEAFQVYRQLLANYPKVRVTLMFNVPTESKDNISTVVAAKVMEIYIVKGARESLEALEYWFRDRSIVSWRNRYPTITNTPEKVSMNLNLHKKWLHANNIDYTPVTIINGFFYPKNYEIKDILLFIEDLLEKNAVESERELVDL